MSFLSGQDETGLNLTCTQLLSTIKYPWSVKNKPDGKIGLFTSDIPTYEKCCDVLGWDRGKRFPFLHLMEAADDIAYSMSDLEDGREKKIISLSQLKEEFGKKRFEHKKVEPFIWFKTCVINEAVDFVSTKFIENADKILQGENIDLLPETSDVGG